MVLFNLALDRIVSVESIDMPYRDNPSFDSLHFFDDVIGVSKNIKNRPRTVRFWASPEQSKYIATKPLLQNQKLIIRNKDGSCVFEMSVVLNYEFYSVMMSYGPGVKVLSPRIAVHYLKDKTREMAQHYNETNI